MITKQDSLQLQKDFKKVFATKAELQDLRRHVDARFDQVVSETVSKTEFQEFKDKFFTMVDQVMGELRATREEQTVGAYRLSEHSDQLENHESRLMKLEA